MSRGLCCQGPPFWPILGKKIEKEFPSKAGQVRRFMTPFDVLIPKMFPPALEGGQLGGFLGQHVLTAARSARAVQGFVVVVVFVVFVGSLSSSVACHPASQLLPAPTPWASLRTAPPPPPLRAACHAAPQPPPPPPLPRSLPPSPRHAPQHSSVDDVVNFLLRNISHSVDQLESQLHGHEKQTFQREKVQQGAHLETVVRIVSGEEHWPHGNTSTDKRCNPLHSRPGP